MMDINPLIPPPFNMIVALYQVLTSHHLWALLLLFVPIISVPLRFAVRARHAKNEATA